LEQSIQAKWQGAVDAEKKAATKLEETIVELRQENAWIKKNNQNLEQQVGLPPPPPSSHNDWKFKISTIDGNGTFRTSPKGRVLK